MTNKLKTFAGSCINNKKLKILLFALAFSGIFFFLFYLNLKTPILGDDLSYSFIYDTTQRVQSLGDIITSQVNHYYLWGGRSIVHFIAQVLLLLPPMLMDAINALAFCVFVLLICTHINIRKPFSLSMFIGAFLLVWFLMPFAETILWITGSANYMWGMILILAFLLIYRQYGGVLRDNIFASVAKAVLIFLCGVICGWTNENVAAAMILMAGLFVFSYRKQSWTIPLWAYTGIIGALVGYMIMILAPGNAIRAEGTSTDAFLIAYRFFRHTQSLLNQLGLLNAAYLILVILFLKENPDKKDRKALWISLIYIVGALAGVYVMLFSPAFPARAWFGVIALNIIAVGMLLAAIKSKLVSYVKDGFIALGILVFAFNLFDVYKDVNEVDAAYSRRIECVEQARSKGEEIVIIERYINQTKYAIEDPLYSEPSMSKYYGVKVKYKQ